MERTQPPRDSIWQHADDLFIAQMQKIDAKHSLEVDRVFRRVSESRNSAGLPAGIAAAYRTKTKRAVEARIASFFKAFQVAKRLPTTEEVEAIKSDLANIAQGGVEAGADRLSRLADTTGLGQTLVAPAIASLRREYPDFERQLRLALRRLDMGRTERGANAKPDQPSPSNIFRRDGDVWQLRYEGKSIPSIKDLKGMHYLAYLLRQPGLRVHVLELCRESSVGSAMVTTDHLCDEDESTRGDGDELTIRTRAVSEPEVDQEGRATIKRELRRLSSEREVAIAANDRARVGRVDSELQKLQEWYEKSIAPNRRVREMNESEKYRKSVGAAIARAIRSISEKSPSLGKHLRDSVETGERCVYAPKLSVIWRA